MADEKKSSSNKIDVDIDGMIDKLVSEGKGWTDEERKKYTDEIGEHPLFADSYEEMNPEYAGAIQSVIYDDQTPFELAEHFKVEGNKCFQKGRKNKIFYKNALQHYQNGLKHITQCDVNSEGPQKVAELHSVLWSNSAAAHLAVRNFGTVKKQCSESLGHWPANIKAHYRLAKACFELKQWDDCVVACNKGLEIDAGNSDIRALLQKAEKAIERRQAEEAEKERAAKAERDKALSIWQHAADLSIVLGHSGFLDGQTPVLPEFDSEVEGWVWPVLFMYPEYYQTDFVPCMAEDEMLALRLAEMFPEEESEGLAPGWDARKDYKCSNLDVYFQTRSVDALSDSEEYLRWYQATRPQRKDSQLAVEYRDVLENDWKTRNGAWVKVHPACTLLNILQHKNHIIPGAMVVLSVYARGSQCHASFEQINSSCMEALNPVFQKS